MQDALAKAPVERITARAGAGLNGPPVPQPNCDRRGAKPR
jgi:hypothetical protein